MYDMNNLKEIGALRKKPDMAMKAFQALDTAA